MEFKDWIKQARRQKGYSQKALAEQVGVHVTNISRYERGENRPTAEVLSRLAEVLEVSVDFLMSGSVQEAANNSISDKELLQQFRQVEKLPPAKKRLIKEFLDAFLLKNELQQKLIGWRVWDVIGMDYLLGNGKNKLSLFRMKIN